MILASQKMHRRSIYCGDKVQLIFGSRCLESQKIPTVLSMALKRRYDSEFFHNEFNTIFKQNFQEERKQTDSEDGSSDEENRKNEEPRLAFPDESFNMVTQSDWEDAIIWDSQDSKVKKLTKNKTAGWVPSGSNRSAQNVSKSQDVILSPNLAPVKIGGASSTSFPSALSGGQQTTSSSSKASKR